VIIISEGSENNIAIMPKIFFFLVA